MNYIFILAHLRDRKRVDAPPALLTGETKLAPVSHHSQLTEKLTVSTKSFQEAFRPVNSYEDLQSVQR